MKALLQRGNCCDIEIDFRCDDNSRWSGGGRGDDGRDDDGVGGDEGGGGSNDSGVGRNDSGDGSNDIGGSSMSFIMHYCVLSFMLMFWKIDKCRELVLELFLNRHSSILASYIPE